MQWWLVKSVLHDKSTFDYVSKKVLFTRSSTFLFATSQFIQSKKNENKTRQDKDLDS